MEPFVQADLTHCLPSTGVHLWLPGILALIKQTPKCVYNIWGQIRQSAANDETPPRARRLLRGFQPQLGPTGFSR